MFFVKHFFLLATVAIITEITIVQKTIPFNTSGSLSIQTIPEKAESNKERLIKKF